MSLKGIKVIDLTRIIAGPFCSQLLADLGAEVIKVETLNGDPLRAQGEKVKGFSWYFAGYNRNKKSVALDLRNPKGLEALKRLLIGADVIIENFRPGVLDKMGLTKEVLSELSPNLIVCSISGFGADGPYSQRPAFDFIAQALSGFMSVTGEADGPPTRSGLPISDLVVGLYSALAVASRLVNRQTDEKSGLQTVDVALTDSMVSLLSFQAANYLAAGVEPQRSGNDHQLVAPYGLFDTSDGQVAIAPSNDIVYKKLLKVLDVEHYLEDERIDTNEKRMANRALVKEIFEPMLAEQTSAYWIEKMNAAGVPVGPVHAIPDVFDDPQIQHRDMVLEVEHEKRGPVKMLGFPMKFSHDPCEVSQPAPELGQHSTEILLDAGYEIDEIRKLVAQKIVVGPNGL
ncbi:MAG: CoA transferase [Pseudomonadota bacterium]